MKGIQVFKCHAYGRQFLGGNRLDPGVNWQEFRVGKQTYEQLAKKYKCSKRTIQKKIDIIKIPITQNDLRQVIVLMDTTYWGRNFGVMLFKDAITKQNLVKYYVKMETNALYKQGIKELKSKGLTINSIVCDGRRGLISSFKSMPVQMCQFHQVAIIRRYITKNPRMTAAIELK